MNRHYATLEESQHRGRAKQRGRYRPAKPVPKAKPKPERKASRFHVGARFGMLVITRVIDHKKVVCRCDCGKETEPWTSNLQKGTTASCGCTQGTHKFQPQPCLLAKVW